MTLIEAYSVMREFLLYDDFSSFIICDEFCQSHIVQVPAAPWETTMYVISNKYTRRYKHKCGWFRWNTGIESRVSLRVQQPKLVFHHCRKRPWDPHLIHVIHIFSIQAVPACLEDWNKQIAPNGFQLEPTYTYHLFTFSKLYLLEISGTTTLRL